MDPIEKPKSLRLEFKGRIRDYIAAGMVLGVLGGAIGSYGGSGLYLGGLIAVAGVFYLGKGVVMATKRLLGK